MLLQHEGLSVDNMAVLKVIVHDGHTNFLTSVTPGCPFGYLGQGVSRCLLGLEPLDGLLRESQFRTNTSAEPEILALLNHSTAHSTLTQCNYIDNQYRLYIPNHFY